MTTALMPVSDVYPTVDANAEQAAKQTSYQSAWFFGLSSFSVTVAVPFQRDDDDRDVLASRIVEQEVLDILDEPASR